MRKDTMIRLAVVAAVMLFSIIYVTPTLEYFSLVSQQRHAASPEAAAALQPKIDALRSKSVPLGLDLQGGVDVLLAVDIEKARLHKAETLADELRASFRKETPAIDAAVDVTSGTRDTAIAGDTGIRVVVTPAREENRRSIENILADLKSKNVYPYFDASQLKTGQPLALIPNPDIITQDSDSTVASAWNVLSNRVNQLGVTQPVVVRQGVDRIRVQIPGEKDPQKVVDTIIKPAVLEFKEVWIGTNPQLGPDNRYYNASQQVIDPMTGKVRPGQSIPAGFQVTPYKERQDAELTPEQRRNNPNAGLSYILTRRKASMTGEGVRDAMVSTRQNAAGFSETAVHLEFNQQGTAKWGQVTKDNLYKPLAIVLDGVCYSYPNILGHMTEGNAEITGNFNLDEARNLALVLKAGALPAELKTLDKREVEATLGADSIHASIRALLIGSILVGLVMISYYGTAGVIAVIAVFINVLLVFAFMRLAGATLTLSGIGGILLTVGMAVDANVLIYERIREELKAGRTQKQAVAVGFGRAFSIIFDTNLTTLISGLTLLQFGEGSVKGFALSLNIGILATMFTGLFCTRTLVDAWLGWHGKIGLGKLQAFKDHVYFDFIRLRKFSFTFSGVLFTFCAAYLLVKGPNIGVDFSGGLVAEVTSKKAVEAHVLNESNPDMRVQKVAGQQAGETRFLVRMKENKGEKLSDVKDSLVKSLDKSLGAGQYSILGTEQVSSEVGKEFTSRAIMACLIASGAILLYIAFRFEFSYGLSAVIALFHDLIITFGLFNLLSNFHMAGEVTLDVVAALLVVLGFSVHDTIIILARVRENRHLHPAMDMKELINRSISESLNRTVMTVGTVLTVLLVMLLFGGAGLYDFALVLLLGIIKGTYSSSFVAAPILYELYLRAKRRGKDISRPNKPAKLGSGTGGDTGRQRQLRPTSAAARSQLR